MAAVVLAENLDGGPAARAAPAGALLPGVRGTGHPDPGHRRGPHPGPQGGTGPCSRTGRTCKASATPATAGRPWRSRGKNGGIFERIFPGSYTNGVVDRVDKGGETLYPAPDTPADDNPLTACALTVKDVESGTGEKIGEYAYIEINKGQLESVTAEQYKDFAETVVKDSGYNWVAIICDDGTGICFPGSMYYMADVRKALGYS